MVLLNHRPPAPAPNAHGELQNAAMRALVPPQLPPPQPHPRLDAQALKRRRHALALQERERKARLAAVRAVQKEQRHERKAERARMQAVMEAQMQAMEAQREYGRRQIALEMKREQTVSAAAAGRDQTFVAPPMVPGPPVKQPRNQPQ